jgi:coproporphyrinogen III oxidase-like Fe-S oxidoreductase
VARLDAPVNANLGADGTVAALADAGAARISIGPRGFHTALAADLLGAR